jgi:hypothetical protein
MADKSGTEQIQFSTVFEAFEQSKPAGKAGHAAITDATTTLPHVARNRVHILGLPFFPKRSRHIVAEGVKAIVCG